MLMRNEACLIYDSGIEGVMMCSDAQLIGLIKYTSVDMLGKLIELCHAIVIVAIIQTIDGLSGEYLY